MPADFMRVLVSLCAAFFLSCAADEASDKEVVMTMLTSGAWKIDRARLNNEDVTDDFADFQLSFSLSDYRSVNAHGCWRASGTWEFEEGTSRVLIRDDGVFVEIQTIDWNHLIIQGRWDATIDRDGNNAAVGSVHRFEFVR